MGATVGTVGGARGIELETLKLLWLMFRLSSICAPNFKTFYHIVIFAPINSRADEEQAGTCEFYTYMNNV